MRRTLLLLLLTAFAAGASHAAEAVPWGVAEYQAQFKYFIEYGTYSPDEWEAMTAAEREQALRETKEPGELRMAEVTAYYETVMRPWDNAAMQEFCSGATREDIKRVKIWMGAPKGTAFENKLALVRRILNKSQTEGLEAADEAALRQHLQTHVIEQLRSKKFAAEMARRAAEKPRSSLSQSSDRLGKMGPKLDGSKLSGMYDNSRSGSGEPSLGGGAATLAAGASMAPAAAKRATTATTIKSGTPAALDTAGKAKSTAWTSDAYGITVETAQGKQSYRDSKAAEAAIRSLPPGSIKKVMFYGHGAPGDQTVGPASYDAASATALLKGKMANDGVIMFAGCNTSSIGNSTLNPAVGISMIVRRGFYFAAPYWGARMDGTPAPEAKKRFEEMWNQDLAREASIEMKSPIVCGYTTFALVWNRLPVITRLMGTQEDTEPGYTSGRKVCFRNGKEVPVP